MKTPEERIQIIGESMRCFAFSLAGFIPLVGIVSAIKAMVLYRRVSVSAGTDWNPAKTYLTWGLVLAWFNLIVQVIILAVFIIVIVATVFGSDGMFQSD